MRGGRGVADRGRDVVAGFGDRAGGTRLPTLALAGRCRRPPGWSIRPRRRRERRTGQVVHAAVVVPVREGPAVAALAATGEDLLVELAVAAGAGPALLADDRRAHGPIVRRRPAAGGRRGHLPDHQRPDAARRRGHEGLGCRGADSASATTTPVLYARLPARDMRMQRIIVTSPVWLLLPPRHLRASGWTGEVQPREYGEGRRTGSIRRAPDGH